MTDLTETNTWEPGIYQFATTDPVQGGPDGLDNKPTRQLANRTQYLRALCDALSASKAPLASPALTGTPTAPTAAAGTNTAQLANTAFVQSAISAAVSSAVSALVNSAPASLDNLKELAAAIGNDANFATTITNALAAKAPLASPALTGTPTAPTAAAGTNSTQLANTAFVQSTVAASVSSAIAALINGAPGALDTLTELATALGNDANFATTVTNALAGKAPLASPALTGTPTAPTAAVGSNTAQLATTAFVVALLTAYGLAGPSVTKNAFDLNNATVGSVITVNGLESDATTYNWPSSGLAASASVYWLVSTSGVATRLMQTAIFPFAAGSAQGRMFVRLKHDANWSAWRELAYADMVAGKASLDSPAFTGTPTVPTPATGANTLQAANAAFVQTTVAAAVSSAIASLVNGSPAALDTLKELATALGNDANFATTITNALAAKAPLASPALTGTPTGPTAAMFDESTRLATTEFAQRAQGNFQDVAVYSASASLLAAQMGCAIQYCGAADGTLTLPVLSTIGQQGAAIHLYNQSFCTLTIAAQGSDFLFYPPDYATAAANTLKLAAGDNVTLMSRGPGSHEWNVVAGSATVVQSALAASGILNVSAATTLSNKHTGRLIQITAAVAVTLPDAATVASGRVIKIRAGAAAAGASVVCAGANVMAMCARSITTRYLDAGDDLDLMSDGVSTWYAVGGTAMLTYANGFATDSASYMRLPNGLIMQFGTVINSASALLNVTFPIAFPNKCLNTVISSVNSTTDSNGASTYNWTQGGMAVALDRPLSFSWLAIGR